MLKNMTTKTRLIIPIFILTVILFFLGGMVIFYSYTQMQSLEKLNNKITMSKYFSATLHALQKERGLSTGYLESDNGNFKKELLMQRKKTDFQIQRLLYAQVLSKSIKQKLVILDEIRAQIDKRKIPSSEVIRYYSDINDLLLEIIVHISKSSHISKITQNILAYVHFLYLKEYGGIERAKGVIVLSHKVSTKYDLIQFIKLISLQNQHEKMFLNYGCNNIKNLYKIKSSDKIFSTIKSIEKNIIYDTTLKNVEPMQWYGLISKKLDILDSVSKFIENYTLTLIQEELKFFRFIFNLIVLLTILSIFIFILMLVAFFKLAKEEQKLRLVTEKYIISSTTDLKGKIIDVSEAFCEISGYEKSELIGKSHNMVRHPDMPDEVFQKMWQTIQQGRTWKGKVKNLKKDGGFYWVWANIEPLYNAHGEIDSYISVRLDITESELLQEKILKEEEKNRVAKDMMYQQSRLAQMGEMLSMIAHQWRQPLSAITAASGAINLKAKLKKLDDKTTIELSNKIMDFSQHLSSTIDDFRGFFKTNKVKTETNFKKMVLNVKSIVQSSLDEDKIVLILRVQSSHNFFTYESELKQVLLNLIKNAQDALKENNVTNPKIIIDIKDEFLSIYDNAGGIDETIIENIFDPYFSTKIKKDGTGLGLYMSKIIVEDHCGGVLKVVNKEFVDEDDSLMIGAKFMIELPSYTD